MSKYANRWQTVLVDVADGIAWVTLNRPEKRNAMSPTLNREMVNVLEALEVDQDAQVLVVEAREDLEIARGVRSALAFEDDEHG